jgi:putative transcriptional regulator
MNPRREPTEERLLAYAAGVLSEPESLVVAVHLALRPQNRAWTDLGSAIGGVVLVGLEPSPLAEEARDRVMARLDDEALPVASPSNNDPTLPEPLRHYALGPWRWAGPGVNVRKVIGPKDGACRVILLRIDPGKRAPRHTHAALELTCVISGAYATEDGVFERGDFEEADQGVLHQPRVVSSEPCVCVAALDGQIVLPGRFGRLLAPIAKL